MPKFRFELVVSEQEQSDEGDPDLSEHGMSAGSKEGLDLEVALDPLEENLDLPAGLVDLSDGVGRKRKVIRYEDEYFTGLMIIISY